MSYVLKREGFFKILFREMEQHLTNFFFYTAMAIIRDTIPYYLNNGDKLPSDS